MQWVEVHIEGHIDRDWSDYITPLTVTHTAQGQTVLSGPIRDQSALLGLMNSLSGLGLRILSVAQKESAREPQGGAEDVDAKRKSEAPSHTRNIRKGKVTRT